MSVTWITADELRSYTNYPSVKSRSDNQLAIDIKRAMAAITNYTHNNFADGEIPENVKTACLLLAEAYAYNAMATSKEMMSETFDDYSYTANDTLVSISDLNLAPLLDEYVISVQSGKVVMNLRKL